MIDVIEESWDGITLRVVEKLTLYGETVSVGSDEAV
jgi:hypothetical protein